MIALLRAEVKGSRGNSEDPLIHKLENFLGEKHPDPKLKTLGEKGIECIFVGYAEHSKAFRFYVIEPNDSVLINSIIESTDVIFDENKFSSVPRLSLRIPNGTEDIGGLLVLERSLKRLQTSWLQIDFQKKTEVARISTIRLLIAMTSIHNLIIHQMDVKTAFLNGELDEEVYMNQPRGFIIPGNENKVDLTKEFLSSRFSMKDMGEADVIFGIRIKHESNGIAIYQSHYIEKVLKKFSYLDCTSVSTPIDTNEKLMPNNVQSVSQLKYSRVIGCLMYAMTCTRPGISFAVGKLSRYTSNPGTQHWQAIQQVLKYLKKTMDYKLTYTGYPSVLEGYTDASWISNSEDNLSTSGWVFLLGRALATTGKKAEWLRNLILKIPLWSKPITPISIRCDSAATLAKAKCTMTLGFIPRSARLLPIPEDGGDDPTVEQKIVESRKELLDSLEAKYMAKDASISCIIDKLPASWKDFKHKKKKLTLVELGSHLRIEKSLRAQDSDKPKGNNVVGPQLMLTSDVVKLRSIVLKKIVSFDLCDLYTTPSLGNKKYSVTFIDDASRYAEHSKAFMFYVIEPNDSVLINSIIESMYAIFDENRFSSVPRPSLRIPNGTEDISGSLVPKEVTKEVELINKFLSLRFSMKNMGEADVILDASLYQATLKTIRLQEKWVFLLGGGAISWASKKQTCITGSTIETEFVALEAAGKEAEWF
ncbi:zinc finger, CCHC-type containing protein [Tanacetum coccineum]